MQLTQVQLLEEQRVQAPKLIHSVEVQSVEVQWSRTADDHQRIFLDRFLLDPFSC